MYQLIDLLRRAIVFSLVLYVVGSASAADSVRVLKDLPYKTAPATEYEQERCKLDLYLPQNAKDFPTIVWFHGGGLTGGDKAGGYVGAMGARFARSGIAVASVNYRLSPKAQFPAYIEDAAAAFAFVHREIAGHGGSAERLFISGHSAGGYLTAMLGLDERFLAKHGLKLGDIAGLVPISGQMITHSTVRQERKIPKTRPIIDEAAPCYHVRKDAPPFLVIAGSQDLPARAEESRLFVACLKAVGHADATYLEVEGRNHGTVGSRLPEADDVVAAAMIAFIERVIAP
jgi:acetyl esterase/lipase